MRKILLFLGTILIVYSFLLIVERYSPKRLNFNKVSAKNITGNFNKISVSPLEFSIPSQDIDLPIISSRIKNNNWETTTKGVSYLITSPPPGEIGNSIIYGHNWTNLLGRLTEVRPGEKVFVRYSDGTIKLFTVRYVAEVGPDQTNILDVSTDRRITVYTCSGFLDSKRFVVVATI